MQNSILKLTGLMAVAFTLAFTGKPIAAQTATAGANSQSGSSSQSGSVATGGSIVFNTTGTVGADGIQTSRVQSVQSGSTSQTQTVTTDGELRTAPSLGGLALGGGHPCAWSPATGQLSIVGGGAGFGGMQIDSACMLMVQAAAAGDSRAYNAAVYMIAGRDPEACKAMYKAGMVADCTDKRGNSTVRAAPTVSTSGKAAAPVSVGYTKCVKAPGNKVVIKYKGNANRALAKSNCLRALGY